ncbi:MAG: molybdenum ABC transporter ATP-binding protein [Pseudomonadota bacterium]
MIKASLRHRFGDFHLEASFDAPEGVTALFGRSGAGKSTVLAAISGLLRPDAGRIEVGGKVVFDSEAGIDVAPHRRRIGVVFQDGRLFPHLSVRANLRFAERFARRPCDTAHLVGLLGLEPLLKRRPAALSGGEKQRVAIARALLSRPDALLLDEPLAALDAARKAEIFPYLERLRQEAKTPMLYVSHSLSEVGRLADRVVLMRHGRTLSTGPVTTVFADAEAAAVMGFRDAGALIDGVVAGQDFGDGLTELALSTGRLILPRIDAPEGARVRVRLRASDVIVSVALPEGLSTRNVLPAVVEEVVEGEGPGALLCLRCGEDRILARLTRRSVRGLGLGAGQPCFAVLKAFAVPPEDITILS